MANKVTYHKVNDIMEYIYYHDSTQTYSTHTHTEHATIGYIISGCVKIVMDGQEFIYHSNEYFCIMPDVPHAIDTDNENTYTMVCLCIKAGDLFDVYRHIDDYTLQLKKRILQSPEDEYTIDNMAKSVCVSPYHMIRQFKNVYGLTPHQFILQSRIRKAQRLLETGNSVIEVALATGFCDQSHFDRCFHKIVGLTPNEYKQSFRK